MQRKKDRERKQAVSQYHHLRSFLSESSQLPCHVWLLCFFFHPCCVSRNIFTNSYYCSRKWNLLVGERDEGKGANSGYLQFLLERLLKVDSPIKLKLFSKSFDEM
jgi:hypothetical protein